MIRYFILAWSAAGLAVGATLAMLGSAHAASQAWSLTALVVAAHLIGGVLRAFAGGRLGVDVIALASIILSIVLGEAATAAVIAVMVAGGEALESWAESRAQRSVAELAARAPRHAARLTGGGVEEVGVEEIRVGDHLLIRPGEAVPTDGVLEESDATLNESALTGEAFPISHGAGAVLRSGGVNVGSAFRMRASARAEASTYAAIVRLTREATQSRPPLARLADRWALGFLAVTAVSAGAAWIIAGEAVRALAVLVVATPCPLILAAPVALVAGVGRAARRGIVIKGSGTLERLAAVRTVLFDKTGTLTPGKPRLATAEAVPPLTRNSALSKAASLAQGSTHPVSTALVTAAQIRGLRLVPAISTTETPGGGLTGVVEGQFLTLGSESFLRHGGVSLAAELDLAAQLIGAAGSVTWLACDHRPVAYFRILDGPRPEASRAMRRLRALGVRRLVMVTGDTTAAATPIGAALRLDAVMAGCTPAEKIAVVQQESARAKAAMVGDGVNDAPALAAAHVGIAMGPHGTAAAAEAADVVLMADRLDRVAEAIAIARRSYRIALSAIRLGMGLSGIAMTAAMAGLLNPLAGAVLQEGIDVAALLFALTALKPSPEEARPGAIEPEAGLSVRLAEHKELQQLADDIRAAADTLSEASSSSLPVVEQLATRLRDRLLPHQLEEERSLYPAAAQELGGEDPTGPLVRMHVEIEALSARISALVVAGRRNGTWTQLMPELRRCLFALEALLTLHLTAEEEVLASLSSTAPGNPA